MNSPSENVMGRGPRSFAQSCRDGSKQFLGIKWFANKKRSALCEGSPLDRIIVMACDEDDRQFRALQPDVALQIQAAHAWHSDVCNQTVCLCEEISPQEVICKGKHSRREPRGFDEASQALTNPVIIIPNHYDPICDPPPHDNARSTFPY